MLERKCGAGIGKSETEHSKEGSKTLQTVIMTSHISFSDDHTRYLNAVKVGLHVRVNSRESYREHLATTFRRESKSWLSGSLRSLLRTPELRDLSEYEVSVYT